MIKILIGGDLCPFGSNVPMFENGDVDALFHDLLVEFRRAELSIVNLECPLVLESSPIEKIGPTLGASDSCINAISKANIGVLNLANNHIMDHGTKGLKHTLESCKKSGIVHVGAGENLDAAKEILILEIKGVRVAILAVAEHEFSIATKTSCGANPLDVINFVRNVRGRRHEFDYLIVLLHGGNEVYPYPRPSLMDTCRFFVEEGANAVICQHTHCPGCHETYGDGHIVYGQGNLIFEPLSKHDKSWHEGFLVILQIDPDCKSRMEIIPYVQSDTHPGARRMQENEEKEFRRVLEQRSQSILGEGFVEEQWRKFCRKKRRRYLNSIYGDSLAVRLATKFHLFQYFYSKQSLLRKLALIRCESHREVLMKVLSDDLTGI